MAQETHQRAPNSSAWYKTKPCWTDTTTDDAVENQSRPSSRTVEDRNFNKYGEELGDTLDYNRTAEIRELGDLRERLNSEMIQAKDNFEYLKKEVERLKGKQAEMENTQRIHEQRISTLELRPF